MDTQEQLDPSITALTKAIGHQESGGDYNKVGDNGHSRGAYQWNNKTPLKKGEIPANFRSYAHEVGANTEDFSPENQDRVAYKTVEKWGKQGLKPAQIASKWNSGGPDTYKTSKPGYNAEQGVNYDVKKYVDNVAKYYDEFSKSGSPTVKKPSVSGARKTFAEEIPDTTGAAQHKGAIGTNPNDTLYGKIIDNSITRGIMNVGNALSFGGAKQLGEQAGSSLAILKEKGKGLIGKQDNSQYIPEPEFGKTVGGAAKVVGSVAALGLGPGLLSRGSALENPTVTKILRTRFGPGKVLANMPRKEVINTLTQTLDELTIGQAKSKEGKAILKALEELNLSSAEKQSLLGKFLKGTMKEATRYALYNVLGNKMGGIVEGVMPK